VTNVYVRGNPSGSWRFCDRWEAFWAFFVPLPPEAWAELLENAGLTEIVTRIHDIDVRDESRGILQRYGCRGMLRTLWRTLKLYLRNHAGESQPVLWVRAVCRAETAKRELSVVDNCSTLTRQTYRTRRKIR
jgi:hypothetical protein